MRYWLKDLPYHRLVKARLWLRALRNELWSAPARIAPDMIYTVALWGGGGGGSASGRTRCYSIECHALDLISQVIRSYLNDTSTVGHLSRESWTAICLCVSAHPLRRLQCLSWPSLLLVMLMARHKYTLHMLITNLPIFAARGVEEGEGDGARPYWSQFIQTKAEAGVKQSMEIRLCMYVCMCVCMVFGIILANQGM